MTQPRPRRNASDDRGVSSEALSRKQESAASGKLPRREEKKLDIERANFDDLLKRVQQESDDASLKAARTP